MENTFFSIIIPHLNEGYTLNITLDSIHNYVKYPNFEIIIVDDGTPEKKDLNFLKTHFLKDKIKLIETQDKGAELCRNEGSKHARGEWLVFLDAHMYLHEDSFDKINSLIKSNTELKIVQPVVGNRQRKSEQALNYIFKDNLGSTRGKPIKKFQKGNLYETPTISGAATIINKKVFEDLGGYNPFLWKRGCDFELGVRAWLYGYKIYLFEGTKINHMYKTKFINTKITFEHTIFNKILTAYTLFQNNKRKNKIIQNIYKDKQEIAIDARNKIKLNTDIQNRIQSEQKKFKHNDDQYFSYFSDYFPDFIV